MSETKWVKIKAIIWTKTGSPGGPCYKRFVGGQNMGFMKANVKPRGRRMTGGIPPKADWLSEYSLVLQQHSRNTRKLFLCWILVWFCWWRCSIVVCIGSLFPWWQAHEKIWLKKQRHRDSIWCHRFLGHNNNMCALNLKEGDLPAHVLFNVYI